MGATDNLHAEVGMRDKVLGHTLKELINVRHGRASYEGIHKRILAGTRIDGIHVCQLIAAMIIASIGLNVDSTEAVVGAMLICPLMGSVIAIAYAVATVDLRFLRNAMTGLILQFIVCLATSTIYFVLSPLAVETSELISNSSPTIWDVLIAFVGGFAGALGLSRQQEPATLLSGVAVATSLMPPLCATGYGLAAKDLALAVAALYEFMINVVFIAFGAELVMVWLRVPLLRDLNGDGVVTPDEEAQAAARSHMLRQRLVIGSLIFAIPCIYFSAQMVRASVEENGTLLEVHDKYDTELTTRELEVTHPEVVDYRVGEADSYDLDAEALERSVVATVETDRELDEEEKAEIKSLIELHVDNIDEVTFEVEGESTVAEEDLAAEEDQAIADEEPVVEEDTGAQSEEGAEA